MANVMPRTAAHLWRRLALQGARAYAAPATSMSHVKDLRERSGAPITDVKAALVEAEWNLGAGRDVPRLSVVLRIT